MCERFYIGAGKFLASLAVFGKAVDAKGLRLFESPATLRMRYAPCVAFHALRCAGRLRLGRVRALCVVGVKGRVDVPVAGLVRIVGTSRAMGGSTRASTVQG